MGMVWRIANGLVLILAVGLATPASAQALAVGSTLIGPTVTISGRTIPLGAGGEWQVVGRSDTHSTLGSPLQHTYVAQTSGATLARWVHVETNTNQRAGASNSHWARDPDVCDRKDVHFAFSDANYSDKNVSCWILNHWGMSLGSKSQQAAIDFFRWSDSRDRPNTALAIEVYLVRTFDRLKIEYFFNPVLEGFPETPTASRRGSPWSADLVAKDPKKLAYLRRLKAQGEQLFQELQTNFR